jgi:hypothetical protein
MQRVAKDSTGISQEKNPAHSRQSGEGTKENSCPHLSQNRRRSDCGRRRITEPSLY